MQLDPKRDTQHYLAHADKDLDLRKHIINHVIDLRGRLGRVASDMSRFPRLCVGGADENATVIYQNLSMYVSAVSCSVEFQSSCSSAGAILHSFAGI